ncbi:uncharacterized protein [Narcine bancroftii]|uniref:uncharacterized protein n=1 Tax=Narcine bancroftii TaxID=1343680 RepID=UPI003831579D
MLRQDRLELDPRNPGAGTHFCRWQRCFLNYVEGAEASDKELLMLLLAQLGDHPYSLIQDARSYQEAMSILQRHYSKRPSELHSRYRLMTRSQQVGESARDFILSLKVLARGCKFKAVSAQEYAEDLIRDRIVAGIQSTEMRHQLLEKGMVGLSEAETIAEALESIRKELEEYSQNPGAGTNVTLLDSLAPQKEKYAASQEFIAAAVHLEGPKCFFCGQRKHPRALCSARENVCSNCRKRGHYAKVCRSPKVTAKAHSHANERRESSSFSRDQQKKKNAMCSQQSWTNATKQRTQSSAEYYRMEGHEGHCFPTHISGESTQFI